MATYAIGDIQGCYRTLQRLLKRIDFDAQRDTLWLVGDLVNRGPDSLSVLRWARDNDACIRCVLGNHDLHLLAVADGLRALKKRDTIGPVLEAADADELLGWLARRPVVYRDAAYLLVHGGLHPAWTVQQIEALGRQIDTRLGQRDSRRPLLQGLYDAANEQWDAELEESRALQTALRVFVTLRTCTVAGRLCASFTGPPRQAPAGCMPWFEVPHRRSAEATVVFGHWAALGLYLAPRLIGTDTGCVWGKSLTAVRLDDRAVFQEPAGTAP